MTTFNRIWFDILPTAICNAAQKEARKSWIILGVDNKYIPIGSKEKQPFSWASCEGIQHAWHPSLVTRFKLHPVIDAMLNKYEPLSIAQLCLEWPHVSEKDVGLLAYTRDDAKGFADIQTTTSIGKYVARHWPYVPDHFRRDVCSLYSQDECYFMPADVDSFVEAVNNGPISCMQDGWNGREPFAIHPYTVYDPDLGWGMAVRKSQGQIDARALTFTYEDGNKVYVRAYSRSESNGYSQGDTALAAWLGSQGFERAYNFNGARFSKVMGRHELVIPYLDGDKKHATSCGDEMEICGERDSPDYACNCTDGTGSEIDNDTSIGSCEHCNTAIEEDDDYANVGRDEDCMVCQCCLDRRYTLVTGSGRRGGNDIEYYVRDNDVLTVNGTSYDSENLPDNIRCLEDGDYFDMDVEDWCEIDDEYYLCEEDRVVFCADGEYRLLDECWTCFESDEWYSNDEDYVLIDGEKYHEDSLAALNAAQQVAPLFPELATA